MIDKYGTEDGYIKLIVGLWIWIDCAIAVTGVIHIKMAAD